MTAQCLESWESDFLQWLQQTYPYSQYHLVEHTDEKVS